MPLLLAVDIVSFNQTKNVIKESWHLKDRKQIEYGPYKNITIINDLKLLSVQKLFSFFNLHLITLDTYIGFYSFLNNVCISFCMLVIFSYCLKAPKEGPF